MLLRQQQKKWFIYSIQLMGEHRAKKLISFTAIINFQWNFNYWNGQLSWLSRLRCQTHRLIYVLYQFSPFFHIIQPARPPFSRVPIFFLKSEQHFLSDSFPLSNFSKTPPGQKHEKQIKHISNDTMRLFMPKHPKAKKSPSTACVCEAHNQSAKIWNERENKIWFFKHHLQPPRTFHFVLALRFFIYSSKPTTEKNLFLVFPSKIVRNGFCVSGYILVYIHGMESKWILYHNFYW